MKEVDFLSDGEKQSWFINSLQQSVELLSNKTPELNGYYSTIKELVYNETNENSKFVRLVGFFKMIARELD